MHYHCLRQYFDELSTAFQASLFSYKTRYPMNFDLTEEQREFRYIVHQFMENEVRPMARHTDETSEFNWTATRKMADLGLKGLQVPEKYGGAEMDSISATIATEELAWACGSTSLAISAHNCLGMGPIAD